MRRKKLRPHRAMGLVSVLFLLAVTHTSLTQTMQNQVTNPDFEEGSAAVRTGSSSAESLPDGSWKFKTIQAPSTGVLDTRERHTGHRSYRIDNGPDGRGYVQSKPFPVHPHTGYRLSGWVKTQDAPEAGVFLRVCWQTKDGREIPATENSSDSTRAFPGAADWRQASLDITSPREAAFASVRLETHRGAGVAGLAASALAGDPGKPFSVWFDGIELTPIGG